MPYTKRYISEVNFGDTTIHSIQRSPPLPQSQAAAEGWRVQPERQPGTAGTAALCRAVSPRPVRMCHNTRVSCLTALSSNKQKKNKNSYLICERAGMCKRDEVNHAGCNSNKVITGCPRERLEGSQGGEMLAGWMMLLSSAVRGSNTGAAE